MNQSNLAKVVLVKSIFGKVNLHKVINRSNKEFKHS